MSFYVTSPSPATQLRDNVFALDWSSPQSHGLRAAWPLTGYPLGRDFAGNAHGVPVGGVSAAVVDDHGRSLGNRATHFDRASSQWLDLPSVNSFSGDLQGSVTAWIRIKNGFSSRILHIISLSQANNADFWRFGVIEGGSDAGLRVSSFVGPNDTVDTDNANVLNDTWHFACLTSDGTTWKMYLDGLEEATTPAAGSNTGEWIGDQGHTTLFKIGAISLSAGNFEFDGDLCDVRLYNRELSAAEIWGIYADPLGLWKSTTRRSLFIVPPLILTLPNADATAAITNTDATALITNTDATITTGNNVDANA